MGLSNTVSHTLLPNKGYNYPYAQIFGGGTVRRPFRQGFTHVHPTDTGVRHHGFMNNHAFSARAESIGLALASVVLGAFLASGTTVLFLQVIMFSLPPASLWMAVRKESRAMVRRDAPAVAQPTEMPAMCAVDLGPDPEPTALSHAS